MGRCLPYIGLQRGGSMDLHPPPFLGYCVKDLIKDIIINNIHPLPSVSPSLFEFLYTPLATCIRVGCTHPSFAMAFRILSSKHFQALKGLLMNFWPVRCCCSPIWGVQPEGSKNIVEVKIKLLGGFGCWAKSMNVWLGMDAIIINIDDKIFGFGITRVELYLVPSREMEAPSSNRLSPLTCFILYLIYV